VQPKKWTWVEARLATDYTVNAVVVAAPLIWFLIDLPAQGSAKDRLRAFLTAESPRLRELLRNAQDPV
jgi:hypothetical protein